MTKNEKKKISELADELERSQIASTLGLVPPIEALGNTAKRLRALLKGRRA